MAKNKKIKTPLSGQITNEMLGKSKVDQFRDATGKVQYSLIRNPLRRFGHWINPTAGYVIKPVGGWKMVDGKKCANEVMLVYQHRVIQKGLIALGIVGAATPLTLELVGMIQEGPVKPDTPPQEPTYSWVCNCDENCKCKDKDQTNTTTPPTTSTTPDEKEEEDEGGFVVKDPEETTGKTEEEGGFTVDTTTPPAGTTGGTTGSTTTETPSETKPEETKPTETKPVEGGFVIPGMMQEGDYSE